MPRLITPLLAIVALAVACPAPAAPKADSWVGPDGKAFRGDPAAIIGPIAVFKTGARTSRRIPLGALSEADCVRFHAALEGLPARAPAWSGAKGRLTNDVIGALQRVENQTLGRLDLAAVPEPEIVLLVFVSNNEGTAWAALDAVLNAYPEAKKKGGDAFEAVFVGVGHNAEQHRNMSTAKNVPFPVTDYHAQQQMTEVKEFAPAKAPAVALVTRHGALLQATAGSKYEDYAKFMAEVSQLLAVRDPNNPAGWSDRAHYLRAVRAATHQNDASAPELVGHPLNLDALRKLGLSRVNARFDIDAGGAVTAVTVAADETLTPEIAAILEPALAKSRFVPAVDHGRPVAGSYDFVLKLAP